MNYRIWYSTESFADFIIANTELRNKTCVKKNNRRIISAN